MNQFNQMSQQTARSAEMDVGLREHMLMVYRNLALGLGLSAITAFLTVSFTPLAQLMFASPLGLVVQFAPLGILFYLMFRMNQTSAATIKTLYWVFAGLKGMALSYVLVQYGMGDIFRAIGYTAGIFGLVSLYGYSTKRDLTSLGFFLGVGVLAIFLAMIAVMVLNLFGVDTGQMSFILFSGLALVVIGLTAYETQQLKAQYYQLAGEQREKAAMMTTLSLYINIVIIFQWILSLLGGRE